MDKDRARLANQHFRKLMKTEDIRLALYMEGVYDRIHHTGHELPQQGKDYLELRNVMFECDNDFIIDAPEYDNLKDGIWYEQNYEPRVFWQVESVIKKLIADKDSRQAVLQFYDANEDLNKPDMICTMFSTIRLDSSNNPDSDILTYTVNMRSCDIREFRSDLKWHKKLLTLIVKAYVKASKRGLIVNPIIWTASSIQCWDKDWEYLKV